jgi:hypothetical protein
LLAKYPDLKGFEGSSVVDVAGTGRAVREAGRQGTTCVMGTSLPSVAGDFLKDGAVDKIFLWDPGLAGQAQDKLALMLIKGEKVGPGLDPESSRIKSFNTMRLQRPSSACLGMRTESGLEPPREFGQLLWNVVARDGVEPPTPAFSGLRTPSLTPFSINNLTDRSGRFIVTTL